MSNVAEEVAVIIEFYGVPRQRAGRADLQVYARTVAEALAQVESACPNLGRLVRNGRLLPHYLLSLRGQRFVTELECQLSCGDRLLLISADAGG